MSLYGCFVCFDRMLAVFFLVLDGQVAGDIGSL